MKRKEEWKVSKFISAISNSYNPNINIYLECGTTSFYTYNFAIDLNNLQNTLIAEISQNKLLTYWWYLNLGCTFRGLGVIQKFNNNDNDDLSYAKSTHPENTSP